VELALLAEPSGRRYAQNAVFSPKREVCREVPPSPISHAVFAAPRAAHGAEPLAQAGCGHLQFFCHILSRRWQPHVNRCFASAGRVPSPPRLIIPGQTPARMMGVLNSLVYLDWPDLRDMTHIPARSMQQMPRRSHRRGKKPRARSPQAAAPGDQGNCLPRGESLLENFLKISQSLPKTMPVET